MNVYFACSSAELDKHRDDYSIITGSVYKHGHKIVEDWIKIATRNRENSKESILKTGIQAIKKSDVLIAEISLPSSSVGYQIALALSEKKPVLCLYSNEFGVKKPPSVIEANNSPLLTICEYSRKTVDTIISRFLTARIGRKLIKFNFIITSEINEYLEWASKDGKFSKSDILRDKVTSKIISSDKEYQLHLHRG